ncbi:MAG: PD40 domain-containing protein [Candidatus Solibacter usitatus]|nr:PD40 domain-containing protein [Candidatus Solibacter usitatus]
MADAHSFSEEPTQSGGPLSGEVHTDPGATLGTVGYMSPEQACGEDLDARTDIFSLGIVLYEMVAGRHPFAGTTPALLFDAILNRTPESPRKFNPATPPDLERIIRRALEKDRSLRFQTMADLHAELLRLRRDTSSRSLPAAERRPSRSLLPLVIAAGSLLALLTAIGVKQMFSPPAAPVREAKLTRRTANPVELRVDSAGLSPDGKYLAFSDSRGISLLLMRTGETQLLPETAGFSFHSWYPDGSTLLAGSLGPDPPEVFWAVSILGGGQRRPATPGRVSPDGSLNVTLRPNPPGWAIWVEGVSGEKGRQIASLEGDGGHIWPVWAPDGKRIAYCAKNPADDRPQIESRSSNGGQATVLLLPGAGRVIRELAWLPDGRLVFAQSEPPPRNAEYNLWEMRIDSAAASEWESPGS